MAARRGWKAGGLVLLVLLGMSCRPAMSPEKQPRVRRDINAVLADHDKHLLGVPGVVGVYVGLLEDGSTPCLKVMLSRADPKLESAIPKEIEGYRVVTEVSGEIKPMRGRQ